MVIVAVGVGVKVLSRVSTGISVGVSVGDVSVAVDMRYSVCRLTTEVLMAVCCAVARGSGLGSSFLGHLHLRLVALVMPATDGGQKVDEEAQHVPSVDERNDPLEHSGYVPVVVQLRNTKYDTKADLGDDKSKLYPERNAEN